VSTVLEPTVGQAVTHEQAQAALDRGDLVLLLSLVEAGRLQPQELDALLQQKASKQWFRRFVVTFFDPW